MKSKLILLVFLLYAGIQLNAQLADSLKYVVLQVNEFQKGYTENPDAVLIDSRDSKDYRKSRIPGAVNIVWPIPENYFTGPGAPGKDKPLFIYCYAGNRSRKVAVIFYDHGYRNLYSLKDGFNGWRLNKMKVDKKRRRALDAGLREEP